MSSLVVLHYPAGRFRLVTVYDFRDHSESPFVCEMEDAVSAELARLRQQIRGAVEEQ